MSDNFTRPEDEQEEAKSRLDRIRGGGASPPPPPPAAPRGRVTPGAYDEEPAPRRRAGTVPSPARSANWMLIIGGLALAGLVIAGLILLLSGVLGGGGALPFMATDTPTPTLTPTATATATETPTPTATATVPPIDIPGLSCLFDANVTCYDFCQNTVNTPRCQDARARIAAQGVDADVWWNCVAPGPGVEGDPIACAEEAWRAAHPAPGAAPAGSTPPATTAP